MAPAPTSIDDYLKGVPPAQRAALQKLREQILRLVPGATETISYSMPAFRVDGHVVAGFLATKKGCSYFPFSGVTLDGMADALAGYSRTKSGLHFDPAMGLPLALLRQLIRARRAEFVLYGAGKTPNPAKKKPTKSRPVTKKPTKSQAVTKKPNKSRPVTKKPTKSRAVRRPARGTTRGAPRPQR